MNQATLFATIHRQSNTDWMAMKVQDPTLLATTSASRSPNAAFAIDGGLRAGFRSRSVASSLCSSAERRAVRSLIVMDTLPEMLRTIHTASGTVLKINRNGEPPAALPQHTGGQRYPKSPSGGRG